MLTGLGNWSVVCGLWCVVCGVWGVDCENISYRLEHSDMFIGTFATAPAFRFAGIAIARCTFFTHQRNSLAAPSLAG